MGSRAFIVSGECYLECPLWLAVGFEIWQSFLTARPYFLPAPSADLTTILPVEATYIDASEMLRALISDWKYPMGDLMGDEPLLLPVCCSYWKEHSPRHNMPSWVSAVMDVSDDWIALLGWWYQKGTAARYVETAERRIRVMQ